MSATNLQANWNTVSFASTAIAFVQDVKFNRKGSLAMYAADMDRFNTLSVALMTESTATLTSGNEYLLINTAPGTTGIFTATHADAKLQTAGAIVYTLANAILEDAGAGGSHGAYGSGQASFRSISADGTTDPLSFARS